MPTGTGGPLNPFCNIMDAILAASSGDTIFVAAGNYQESLIIDKDINIIGTAGAAQTTSTPGSLHAQQL